MLGFSMSKLWRWRGSHIWKLP